jgi:glucose/arabinose dehydrogenase
LDYSSARRFFGLLVAVLPSVASAATLPTGFTETTIAAINSPTAMAVAPDGRVFVSEQGGSLRVVKNDVLLPTPFVTLAVDPSGERGLLGVAVDPNFASNQFVYLYHTTTTPTTHNRIIRLTANGDVAAPGSMVVLLELDTLGPTNHNGGGLHFGADGKLYASAGENGTASNAQTLTNLLGKILRINTDGSIPTNNPFFGIATGKNQAIFAYGLRNPFTFDFQPGTGRLLINDVGEGTTEEIDDGVAGANYGWPQTEGPNPGGVSGVTYPIFSYGHTGGACAITGGVFYNPPSPSFPAAYLGKYFFGDYCAGFIRSLNPSVSPATASNFATGISSLVDLRVAANGDLYYLSQGDGLVRIHYVPPQARTADYFTVTPCRLLDTRLPTGQPALSAGQTRSLQVTGRCGVPAGAGAVSLNVTAVIPTAPGFLELFSSGSAVPSASSLNYVAGQVRANNGIFALSTGGALDIFLGQAAGTSNVVVDVTGYFVGP